ncbi:hypothetical protein HY631_03650 [Candidatus Uhrbacteria bacterium]|nr:hypothetical protein [Candidatus Uhrbacteria bacterium]
MTITHKRLALFLAPVGLLLALAASASFDDVVYPVAELGNCESKDACFTYCGEPTNYDACMAYAQEYELLEEEEIAEYLDVQELVATGGPGGCTDQASCDAYCGDLNNMSECLSFARDNGLMDEGQLEEATKVLAALEAGYAPPGGCSDQTSCDAYCGDVSHAEECLSFAEAAGFMSEEEANEARTMMTIMASGEMPGGCQSKEACDAYCGDEANREECTAFALDNGLITQEELDRMVPEGEFAGPGGCASPDACKMYCEQEANYEECSSFFGGETQGPPEEFDESFVGPGGCTTPEECMSYCSDPENGQACASFAGEELLEPEGFEETGERKEELEHQEEFEGQEFAPPEFEGQTFEGQEGREFSPMLEQEYREPYEFQGEGDREFDGQETMEPGEFIEPGEYQAPYEQEPYQYEGGQEDTEIHYNEEGGGFEGFDPGAYELDFGTGPEAGLAPGGDTAEGAPAPAMGGEPQGGGAPAPEGEPQSLAPMEANAGFAQSVRQFFSRVTSKAKTFLTL